MTIVLGGDGVASARPQIWRVTDRGTLAALRSSTHRARRGPLRVTWLPPAADRATEPPRVAFAIGRAAGGAVVRNRIRRRLRAAMRDLAVTSRLPQGAYLIGGRGELASLPWSELTSSLDGAVRSATGTTP